MTFAALFNNAAQAAQYSLNRPHYPCELYELILRATDGRSLAVDIATGSGQAAIALAASFVKVIGIDDSEQQLAHAMQQDRIQYLRRDAHHTGLPDQCADLVTVAQALHWFDHAAFYREVRRILKPVTGVFAAWAYSLPVVLAQHEEQPGEAQRLLMHLYEDVLGPYWAPRRRLVEQGYKGIEPSVGTDFQQVARHQLQSSKVVTVDQLLGYLSSWSAYHTFLKEQPGAADPLVQFKQDLITAVAQDDKDTSTVQLTMTTPITVILCQGPTAVANHSLQPT